MPNANPRTELGRLGGAFNEMLGQIEEGHKQRDRNEQRLRRFVADAAHELRTPLTSVRGYSELYRQRACPDQQSLANAVAWIESESAFKSPPGQGAGFTITLPYPSASPF